MLFCPTSQTFNILHIRRSCCHLYHVRYTELHLPQVAVRALCTMTLRCLAVWFYQNSRARHRPTRAIRLRTA